MTRFLTNPIFATMISTILMVGSLAGCSPSSAVPTASVSKNNQPAEQQEFPLQLSEEQWKERLSPQQFHVLREHGTERAFSGKHDANYEDGEYQCAACGHPVFASSTKFDSRTGWPSFYEPLEPQSIGTSVDNMLGQQRTEVHCANCGGHLGHVFPDGPKPTGLRYCLNSVSLTFTPAHPE